MKQFSPEKFLNVNIEKFLNVNIEKFINVNIEKVYHTEGLYSAAI